MENDLAGKRALFIFDCLELGGAERQALLLASHLKNELGMEVFLLGLSEKEGVVSRLCREEGIPSQGMACNLSGSKLDLLRTLLRALLIVRRLRPDVVLPYTWRPNVLAGLIWRFTGAGVCLWNQRDEGIGLDDRLRCRLAVRLSSRHISNSSGGKDFLVRRYALRAAEVSVVKNGVALPEPGRDRAAWRRALGIDEESFVACMVANLHQFKDHGTLIRAWRRVIDRTGGESRGACLLLSGRFCGTEKGLKELARELGLEERVRFLGPVTDISVLLRSCDLYLHSSHTEGVPNAVLEAMAAGLPVVATDIAGIREAVGGEGAPGLVPAGDESALSERIAEFMTDSALRRTSAAALKARARNVFPVAAMTSTMADLIRRSLKRGG